MGSTGSWDASLSLRKRISLKQTKKNTSEEIKKFISKNDSLLSNKKEYDDIEKGDILIGVDIYDDDDDLINTVSIKDLGIKDVDAKDFIDKELYKEHDEFVVDDYYNTSPEYWVFNVQYEDKVLESKVKDLGDKLKFINLKLLQSNLGYWSMDNPNFIHDQEHLASCSDYIYCGNDNSSTDTFKITKKFIDSLNVGDELVLYGNGDGEHC